MAKSKKAAAKKRAYKKRVTSGNTDLDIFEIEETPPPNKGRTQRADTMIMLQKVARTVAATKTGQAFLIPANKKVIIRKFLNIEFPGYRFQLVKIPDNPAIVRAYILQPLKK